MSSRFHPLLSTLLSVLCVAGLSACGAEEPLEPGRLASVKQGLFFDVDLGSSLGSPVATGTTTGWGNDFNSNCGSGASEDKAFSWVAPYTGTFTFHTAYSFYDTVLQVLNTDQSVSLGCNDEATIGTTRSSLSRVLTAGQRVTIVVDGFREASGQFVLHISGSPLSPIPTNSLQLWLRTDVGVTASGGLISSWGDQSGNGRDATMTASTRQPGQVPYGFNNWPVVRFGGEQSLYLTSLVRPTKFTLFVVGKNTMPTETFSMILGPGGSSANNQLRWENGSRALFVGTGNNMPVITSNVGDTRVFHALSALYNGSWMSVYRDGNLTSNHAFSVTGPWELAQVGGWFSSYFMKGDLAEILIYDRTLSESERAAVNAYLRAKYSLP